MKRGEAKPISQKIGEFIRDRRNALNMTQNELGVKVGYRYGNFIAMLERGTAMFPFEKWAVYAEALNVPKHEFLKLVISEQFPEMLEFLEFKEAREDALKRRRLERQAKTDGNT